MNIDNYTSIINIKINKDKLLVNYCVLQRDKIRLSIFALLNKIA